MNSLLSGPPLGDTPFGFVCDVLGRQLSYLSSFARAVGEDLEVFQLYPRAYIFSVANPPEADAAVKRFRAWQAATCAPLEGWERSRFYCAAREARRAAAAVGLPYASLADVFPRALDLHSTFAPPPRLTLPWRREAVGPIVLEGAAWRDFDLVVGPPAVREPTGRVRLGDAVGPVISAGYGLSDVLEGYEDFVIGREAAAGRWPPAADVGQRKTKGRDINARMLSRMAKGLESVLGWSAEDWADQLNCSPGTVKGARAWRELMKARAERAALAAGRCLDPRTGGRPAAAAGRADSDRSESDSDRSPKKRP